MSTSSPPAFWYKNKIERILKLAINKSKLYQLNVSYGVTKTEQKERRGEVYFVQWLVEGRG